MHSEKILQLSKYRIDKAKEEFETASVLVDMGRFSQSINRSYYAIFHAVRALLALDEVDFKKHSGVISYFQQHYIKTKKLDNDLSNILVTASTIRNQSDYNDFFVVSRESAGQQLTNADRFIKEIELYLKKTIVE